MAPRGQNNNQVVMSSTSSPVEDLSGPFFFLHNGDHPGLILVSHPLHGPNYNTWSRAMLMALTAKNKTSFINSSIPQPAIDYLLYGAWNRCNNMVDSWILNSVAWEIADSLLYISTTTEIWNDLRERFHQTNAPRIFKVRKALMALNQGFCGMN